MSCYRRTANNLRRNTPPKEVKFPIFSVLVRLSGLLPGKIA